MIRVGRVVKREIRPYGLRKLHGYTVIETLMTCLCLGVIGTMIMGFMQINITSIQETMQQNQADFQARRPLDNLVDCIRKAQPYGSGGASLSAATAQSITIYTDMVGDTAQYWFNTTTDPGGLESTISGTSLVLSNSIKSLQFTYYIPTGYTPSVGSCWKTTTNPNAPTAAELPQVTAVNITITYVIDQTTRTYTSPVRLANGSRTVSGH